MQHIDLAVFLPSLAGGGAERVMVTLCNAFARQGLNVALVLVRKDGPYEDQVDSRVRVVDLGRSSVPKAIIPLARYLREAEPQVLLSAMAHANMAAILARRIAGVPTRVIVSERNTLSQVVKTSRRPFISLLPLAMRFVYPSADGIIAVSGGVADDLARTIGLPRGRIAVVYNPIDTEEISEGRQVRLDHPWFEAGAPPVILTAGRLIPAKDHACLLEAFAPLRRDRACRLVILGEGDLRASLEQQAESLGVADDVLLPGFLPNPFNWMQAARVFVLSSRHEGLPGVMIQAMSCGTPVVSTDCPSGPAEILEHGKWGRLVPVGDAVALTRAIAATLDDPVRPDVERRAADFSLDRALEGYGTVMGLVS